MHDPKQRFGVGRRALACAAVSCLAAGSASAQVRPIEMLAGPFTPVAGTPLFDAPPVPGSDRKHGVLQFGAALTPQEHAALATKDIRVLSRLESGTYVVSVPAAMDRVTLQAGGAFAGLESADLLGPAQKVTDRLDRGQYFAWAGAADRLRVVIQVFRDVDEQRAAADLAPFGATRHGPHSWAAIINVNQQLPALTALDVVKLVQQGPAPAPSLNAAARERIETDAVQSAAFDPGPMYEGLTGAGVQVGICDDGIDENHNDFFRLDPETGVPSDSRIVPSTTAVSGHGTHVASIVAGSGYNSALNEDEPAPPYHWRGHAPEATLGEFTKFRNEIDATYQAVVEHATPVFVHPYVQHLVHEYDADAAGLDTLIRGDATLGGVPVPRHVQVWSAGNNGTAVEYGDETGYYSVFTTAKNTISVGSVNSEAPGHVSSFSSLGPTLDGRIKPDVVAPGTTTNSKGVNAATAESQFYETGKGTSMAAPAVAGVIALAMQQYERTYGAAPTLLSSTYKALLIHGATDLDETSGTLPVNPDTGSGLVYHTGPDFASGFGLVNTPATCALIAEPDRWFEDSLTETGQEQTWSVTVPAGAAELKVVIAWDDEPGDTTVPGSAMTKLVNDLDLVLTDPDGADWLPWTLPHVRDAAGNHVVVAATRGADHVNNVEMVTVDNPGAGTWTITVRAHDLAAASAQPYSLVTSHALGSTIETIALLDASTLCDDYPWSCERVATLLPLIKDGWWTIQGRTLISLADLRRRVPGVPAATGRADDAVAGFQLEIELPADTQAIIVDATGVERGRAAGGAPRTVIIDPIQPRDRFSVLFADKAGKELTDRRRVRLDLAPIGGRRPPARRPPGASHDPSPPAVESVGIPLRTLVRISPRTPVYGTIALARVPTRAERRDLADAGITLAGYRGGTVYYAAFGRDVDLGHALIEDVGRVPPASKLHPDLRDLDDRGPVPVAVRLHRGVDDATRDAFYASQTGDFAVDRFTGMGVGAVTRAQLRMLARQNLVRYIEPARDTLVTPPE